MFPFIRPPFFDKLHFPSYPDCYKTRTFPYSTNPWQPCGYSEIVVLLTRLTHKDVKWNFTDDAQQSFNALKHAFTSAPVLTHWILGKPLVVETDASDYALATILLTQDDSGKIHPIAFHSQCFTSSEINYNTHDKELLAIFAVSKLGDITLKVLRLRSTWSPITRTWNISALPKF